MSAPALELQKACREALLADAPLAALVEGRIFDHVPAGSPFPYLVFGASAVFDWSSGGEPGTEHLVTLHAWSKGRGKRQALELMDRARAALDGQALALEGHRLVLLRLEHAEALHEDDLDLYHGRLRLRALIEAGAG